MGKKKLKNKCCKKYTKKGNACNRCPLSAMLCKRDRKRLFKRYKEKRKKSDQQVKRAA